MKLYSGPVSLFTAKVRIALAEKRLAPEIVTVGWSPARRYEPHHPDVVALNPKRQVPVLVDGEAVVCDSTLILEYLEDAHPEPPLMPRDAAGRARCRGLEAFADEQLFPAVWDLIEELLYPAGAAGRDVARVARAKQALGAHAARLERELDASGGPWLCGAFSTADIGCFVMWSTAAAFGAGPAADTPRLAHWLGRCLERPSLRDEVAGMRAHLARVGAAPPAGGAEALAASPA